MVLEKGITFTIDDAAVHQMLADLRERGGNLRPALTRVAAMMKESIRANFAQGGRPRWLPLKSRQGKPLRDTGRLMNSISRTVTGSEVRVGTNVVYAAVHHFGAAKGSFGSYSQQVRPHERLVRQVFGRPLRQAKKVRVRAHARRAKLPWGDIPARPFMVVPEADMAGIRETLARYLTGERT